MKNRYSRIRIKIHFFKCGSEDQDPDPLLRKGGSEDPDPDQLVPNADPRIQIHAIQAIVQVLRKKVSTKKKASF